MIANFYAIRTPAPSLPSYPVPLHLRTLHRQRTRPQTQTKCPRHTRRAPAHSWIFARISESRNKKYSCTHDTHVSLRPPRPRDAQTETHLVPNLDRVPAPARKQHPVARLHDRRTHGARLVGGAGPGRDDGRLRERAVRRGRRQVHAARGFLYHIDTSVLDTRTHARTEGTRTVSGLKRRTRTRSRRGTTALMLLNVAWAACRHSFST